MWNLPNVLTLGRILIIPVVVWLMVLDTPETALFLLRFCSARPPRRIFSTDTSLAGGAS